MKQRLNDTDDILYGSNKGRLATVLFDSALHEDDTSKLTVDLIVVILCVGVHRMLNAGHQARCFRQMWFHLAITTKIHADASATPSSLAACLTVNASAARSRLNINAFHCGVPDCDIMAAA